MIKTGAGKGDNISMAPQLAERHNRASLRKSSASAGQLGYCDRVILEEEFRGE